MKSKGHKNLTYTQRLQLEAYLRMKIHKKEIARNLGVCLATVYNEIKRGQYFHTKKTYNSFMDHTYTYDKQSYSPMLAEQRYRQNMTAKGAPLKIGNDYNFVRYVEQRILVDKLSPCAVVGELKRTKLFKTSISKTTMYRYISDGIFMNVTYKNLPFGRRKKQYRKVAKRPPRGTSIEKRPAEIAERNSFGHWEMDCVCGSTKATLLVLSERFTRKEIILGMPNRKAESVIYSLNCLERRYGKQFRRIFKSITVDNGVEFSDSIGLERSIYGGKRTSLFYCHPYSSYERGTNERLNRDIRRHFPKGTDFSKVPKSKIQNVEDWVNSYPREIFGFASANEVFSSCIIT